MRVWRKSIAQLLHCNTWLEIPICPVAASAFLHKDVPAGDSSHYGVDIRLYVKPILVEESGLFQQIPREGVY